ncbi:MAG: hypothetical protein WCO09_03370, partial [bacterium]
GTWSHPPKEWEFEEDYKKLEEIRKLLRTFCKDKGILPRDWHKILEDFLFYNRVLLTLEPNAKNLCFVSDGVTGLDSLGHKVDEDDLEIYPVTLHISPYASERDILDYIHAVYKPEIERVQNTYKRKDVGIGKYKKSNYAVSKRNAVIFNNRYSPSKKISRTIKEEFPEAPLKLSSINKTISREQKRRQQL